MSYILIPRIKVFGANAQSTYNVVSGPSPLAFLGMIRKLAIDCGRLENSEKIKVAIIHHHLEMRGEQFNDYYRPSQHMGASLTIKRSDTPAGERNGASDDYLYGKLSMGLQPVALCNFKVSLIVSGLDGLAEQEITNKLLISRCAGGHIRQMGQVKSFDNIKAAAVAIGSGYFMFERQDFLKVSAAEKPAAFINVIAESKKEKGWFLPMNLGYLAVTPFEEKSSSRGNLKHAYAEPLMGIVQYKTHRILENEKKEIPFWRYQNNQNVFVVTTEL